MTVKEVLTLCGGFDYDYELCPRERIGFFYASTKLKWYEVKGYFLENSEILKREVSRITAVSQNSFKISYYVTPEDIERIKAQRGL